MKSLAHLQARALRMQLLPTMRTSAHPPSHPPPGRPISLLQLLAVYVAVVLLLQSLAAAVALGRGPLHHHVDSAPTLAAAVFSHHAQAHASGQRHHHDEADTSVVREPAAEDSLDLAAFALTAALALLALDTPRRRTLLASHVQRATAPWAWRTALPCLPFKPPR